MRLAIMTSWIICSMPIRAQTAEPASVDIRKAPPIPPWPQDLPVPRRTPSEARCVDGEGGDLGGGVWLDSGRAEAVHARLEILLTYPARCQARLDALQELCRLEVAESVDVALADAEIHRVEDERKAAGYALSTVFWAGAGGLLIGALAIGVAALVR